MKNTITPEEGEEVKKLWEQYEQATMLAGKAISLGKTDEWKAADSEAGKAIKRIKEIYGVAGVPWMAI